MLDSKLLAREIDDRRNWSAFALAGSLVFLGAGLLDALGLKNAISVVVLVALAAWAARSAVKA